MASGTVVFQSATLATPAANLSVMADAVNDSDHGAGTTQYVKIMDGATAGTAKAGVTTANGLAVDVTRVQGTVQALGSIQGVGTFQVLGTVQTHGTSQVIGTFQAHGTAQIIGTVQTHGTSQALGTFQPLAGSVHLATNLAGGTVVAVGSAVHGAAADTRPLLISAFGSSGTQAAVDDGDAVRLWADVNGRLQVRGTIDSLPNVTVGNTVTVTGTVQTHGTSQVLGTVQTHGTSQVLGTIQLHGTNQALGTFQPLAGSVHLATNLAGGTVVAVGSALHGAVADTRPLLMAAFGSSGTQAAVDDGDSVRLWADLNGRLQVRGTIDSLVGTVQTHGTSQVLGTVQAHGTVQALGTVTVRNELTPNGDTMVDDTNDALRVNVVAGSGAGVTHTDDAAFTPGTDDVVPAAGIYRSVRDSVDDNDAGAVAMTQKRALLIALETPNADSAMDDTNDAVRVNVVAGGGAGGGTSASDDSAFTPATTAVTPIGAFADETTPDSVDEGDVGAVRMSLNRNLYVTLRDAAGNERGANIDASNRLNVAVGNTVTVTGTVQAHGTAEALGTFQPLAGSVHLATNLAGGTVVSVGSAIHGAVADTRPHLISAFGSSGTQAAVDDGDAVRLWADLNGRLQVRGTIDSLVGTVQTHGTSQVLGTVQLHGTNQALGTFQPLAGSVHLATNLAGGTVVAVGSALHGAVADTRPLLMSAFGSSGTQAAIDDGDAVRLWADLNGRLQVRGTIDSLVGTVQTHGTSQVLGTVQTHGTSQVLGSVRFLDGSVHIANTGAILTTGTASVQGLTAHTGGGGSANPVLIGGVGVKPRPGTVSDGSVTREWYDQQGRQVVQVGAGTTEVHGTTFTGAGANGTILAARGAGSFWRVHDIVVSGSAAGTFAILQDTGVWLGPFFIAANGGWNHNSAVGLKHTTANTSLVARFTAGTWSIFINYSIEGM